MAGLAPPQPSAGAACVFEAEELLSPEAFVRQLEEVATRHAEASAKGDLPARATLAQELQKFGSQKKMHLRGSCVTYCYEGEWPPPGAEYSSAPWTSDDLSFTLLSPSLEETTRRVLSSSSNLKLDLHSFIVKSNAVVQLNGHIGLAQGLVTPFRLTPDGDSFHRVAYTLALATRPSGHGFDKKPVRVYAPDLILGVELTLGADGAGSCEASLVYESEAFLSGTKMCEMGVSRF
ncbi:hypothetical protein JCM1840_002589 [Sporobolomyces johnsonii]